MNTSHRTQAMMKTGLWLIFSGLLQIAFGAGHIEVHFRKYSDTCNENFGINPCDPMFTFCLSTPQTMGSLSVENCNYASTVESQDQFQDSNIIELENLTSIGGLDNPWIVRVSMFMEPTVMLVARSRDADVLKHDHLQTWAIILNETVWASKEQSKWIEHAMTQNEYTMVFKVRMYCDPFYYTQKCDKYCVSNNSSTGHYICEENCGNKICLAGWQGEQCTDDIDECLLGYCVFGQCLNIPGDYICSCYTNYSGRGSDICAETSSFSESSNCSEIKDPCRPNPCQNGGLCFAHSSEYSYFCKCSEEWQGEVCDERNPCALEPCLKNGSCPNRSPSGTNYNCTCVYPYNGSNCKAVEPTLSLNHATEFKTTSSITIELSLPTTTLETINGTSDSQSKLPVSNVQKVRQEGHDEFQLWYIALIVAAVLLVTIITVVILFIKKRRQRKATLNHRPA